MGSMKPRGAEIELGGEQRELLFTLNAIDELQDRFEEPVSETLKRLINDGGQGEILRTVMTVLLNDEADRKKWLDPSSSLKGITEHEAGWLIDSLNMRNCAGAIFAAYGLSMPEPEDSDPNAGRRGMN